MNSMEAVREATDNRREHLCTSACSRNSEGYCLIKIELWRVQHRAALNWNEPGDNSTWR